MKVLLDQAGDVLLLRQTPSARSALTKLSGTTGATLWERSLLDTGITTIGSDFALDGAGNAYVVGSLDGAAVALEVAGADGAVVWQRTVEGYAWPRFVNLRTVALDAATNLIVGGDAIGRVAFWKLSGVDGSMLWRSVYPSPPGFLNQSGSLVVDANGDAFAAGSKDFAWGYDLDMALWKMSGDGTIPFCGNGVLDSGEECDDGNAVDRDGCDHDCARSLCVGGVDIRGAKLTFSRLAMQTQDVVLVGDLAFPPGSPPTYDPVASGIQILIEDVTGGLVAPLDLTSRWVPLSGNPAGVCDPALDAWSAVGARLRFTNRSRRGDAPSCRPDGTPPSAMQFSDRRAAQRGISFKAKFTRIPLPQIFGPPRVTVVLGSTANAGLAGACATHTFATSACRWNAKHTTYSCRERSS